MTDAEVRQVLSDAQSAGVMERAETEMIAGVMRIADRTARGLMTPRREVDIVDIDASPEEIAQRFRETRRSRLPVRDGGDDEIVGVFFARDFLGNAPAADTRDPRSLLHPLPVIRDGLAALDVIEALRKSSAHMLLVYDEYGHFEGIVTPMNLLESIAGDFSDEPGAEAKVIEREDGSLLVSGWMPADEFADRIGITLPEDRDYETVAGLVLERMGQLPPLGASFQQSGWRIEVVDLDGRRIDKLLVSRVA
jgi:putative hemolysin